MSLHFQFNSQAQQEDELKEVTFKVEPLMCMEKCARSIAFALSKLVPAQNLAFDIPNKHVTIKMPQSMSEDAIINNLKLHGRSAQVYVPENRMGYGAGK